MRMTILANEFFDAQLGRSGGFGWAAREAARCLRRTFGHRMRVSFLHGEPPEALARPFALARSDGFEVRAAVHSRSSRIRARITPPPHLILTIDYRPSFDGTLQWYGEVPTLVWARDPRTPADWTRVQSLRLPGVAEAPVGVTPIACDTLATVSGQRARPVLVAAKMPHIALKCEATYGLPASGLLPNPSVFVTNSRTVPADERPLVLFLGRLDPIKRPWLVIEVARRLPQIQFVLAGKVQVGSGPGVWSPRNIPSNVSLVGQVDGDAKQRLLQRAWMLLNTSIYEETPVSWFEAMAYGIPLVSTIDCGGLVSTYGEFVGDFLGDGLESVPLLVIAIQRLLEPRRRRELGEAGAAMVREHHTDQRFSEALAMLASRAGVKFWPR